MPIKLGETNIVGMAVGDVQAQKVYRGASFVLGAKQYQNVPGDSPAHVQEVPAGQK